MIETLKKYIRRRVLPRQVNESGVVEAYNLWALNYDVQPGNLMLDLDEILFSKLLATIDIKNKAIADIGCGTGRHWDKIFRGAPASLAGFDVSPGMLDKLKEKFPAAETHTIADNQFSAIGDNSYDVIVSTLTVAHIQNLEEALAAWCRIAKPAADMVITDFHPDALAFGGKRTFKHENKQIAIQNFVHSTHSIKDILKKSGFYLVNEEERKIDETVRHYYEEKNALAVYEKFKGFPVIYAMHLRRGEMILNGVKLADTAEPVSIRIADKRIAAVSASPILDENAKVLNFDNAIVFPGLINSHDHLDFNLFPQLRNGIYNNYTEWGKDIHQTFKNEIADVLKIPFSLRLAWGLYKNLLCGVTTVVNHGEKVSVDNPFITVFEDSQCLHSVHFEKGWQIKLNNPFKAAIPVNMHIGEGNDWLAFSEIEQLKRWNLLGRKLVGVHAAAMSENQAKKFKAVVWCPDSNYFLLNKTANVNVLSRHTTVLFGTDSTLTASWNIWEHLRLARKTQLLSDGALYKTINENPAKIWKLDTGKIAAGADADIVVAKTKPGTSGLGAFFNAGPADLLLVMHKGMISLFDDSLLPQLENVDSEGFSKIYFGGICKYVRGDLPGLVKKIRQYYPAARFPVGLEYIVPIL